jgi:ferritin-like metal-binding protein YciE
MAAVESLRTHLVDELIDLLDAEQQLTKALPKLAEAATSRQLRSAFQKHLKETRGHVNRLTQALRALGESPSSKRCEAMKGLLDESDSMMKKTGGGPLRDAVMITGAQKVEHYEMASYGTARTYARVLGERTVARLLEQTLKEEKLADRTLTQIAQRGVNREAATEWKAKAAEEGVLLRTAEWAGTTAAYATQQVARGIRAAASTVGLAGGAASPRPRRPAARRAAGKTTRKAKTAAPRSARKKR